MEWQASPAAQHDLAHLPREEGHHLISSLRKHRGHVPVRAAPGAFRGKSGAYRYIYTIRTGVGILVAVWPRRRGYPARIIRSRLQAASDRLP